MGMTKFAVYGTTMLLLVVLASGCATTTKTQVLRPAKINLVGVKGLAIGGFGGEGGPIVRAQILKAVFDSQRFDVVDRENLGAGITEMELQQVGLASGEKAVGMQRADALVTGKVDQRCNQGVESGQFTQTDANGRAYNVTLYQRWAKADVTLAASVTNLSTMKCDVVDNIPASYSAASDWLESPPGEFDPRSLYESCYPRITSEFMKDIAPYTEIVKVNLLPAKHAPETEAGIQLFQAGQFEQALKQFEKAEQTAKDNPKIKPDELSAIKFDIGVAKEYLSDYDGAVASVQEAITLCPGKKIYTESISRINERRKDANELKRQGVLQGK